MTSPWYASYFSEPYGEVYANYLLPPEDTVTEAKFTAKALKLKVADRILDCPCGYGRHLAEWKKFPHIVGLDLDADCLVRSKATVAPESPVLRGDMRSLPFADNSFDVIINLFNSFGYFTPKENRLVLDEWYRVLAPKGRLLIDIVNPPPLVEIVSDNPRTMVQVRDLVFTEDWGLDAEKNILSNRTTIQLGKKRCKRSYKLQLYSFEELQEMLAEAGFKFQKVWGDFDGEVYAPDESDRLIVIATK
ncbi:TPA: hypothetical protein DDW35_02125 [Candidatus Sumerlaeota bacterium]|jgi:SAM-dependent methyltransferase|nr:hypothetical protein [Candidatus Sumerlaeota bacterium]